VPAGSSVPVSWAEAHEGKLRLAPQ
jgi:hypothetical protein